MSSRRPPALRDSEEDSDEEPPRKRRPKERRCRPLESEDEDGDGDGDGNEDEEEEAKTKAEGWRSDSSEGDSDKCPVCLLKLAGQEIGTPDACDHAFCSDCLVEWSNHVNTCPVDRKEFASVLVRKEVGGRVIRSVPVGPRRISLDELVEEQPTVCQICRSAESEETMLLCDMCDLGFHMECLNPPLDEVPSDEWFCPTCASGNADFWADASRIGLPTPSSESRPETTVRPGAAGSGARASDAAPSTSSQSGPGGRRVSSGTVRSAARSRAAGKRRRVKRRRRAAAIVEYEIRDGEKFPSKRKYVSKKRKKKTRRRIPRTAARRALVRTSVRGRLAELLKTAGGGGVSSSSSSNIVAPQLSLFGNRDELDYVVSDDETVDDARWGGAAAVAVAPRFRTSALLEAHRQNRRKMISIPSPAHASSAPDILSAIMESQSLLHSKKSTLSLKNDGSIVIEVPKSEDDVVKKSEEEKIDVTKPDTSEVAKEAPAYGSNRGGGGGGNWRGNRNDYHGGGNQNRNNHSYGGGAYQGSGRGNYWEGNNYGNENFGGQGNSYFNSDRSWQSGGSGRAPQRDSFPNYPERSPQRRNNQNSRGRGNQSRHSQMPQRMRNFDSWEQQNYSDVSPPYREQSEQTHHGYRAEMQLPNTQLENVIDQMDSESFDNNDRLGVYEVSDLGSSSLGHLPPQPPIIRFKKPAMSDEGNSDNETKIDTDKYDPTEPTVDDSSGDEEENVSKSAQQKFTIVSPPQKIFTDPDVSDICVPSESLNISPARLDHAVQQVLKTHENLLTECSIENPKKDCDSDGNGDVEDVCPNFSVYSLASMEIAKGKNEIVENKVEDQLNMVTEDLVQEDDCDFSDVDTQVNSTTVNDASQQIEDTNDVNNEKNNEASILVGNTSKISPSVVSKFMPKRNVIKINLSSNMGIKKRLLNNDTDKDLSDKNDCSSLNIDHNTSLVVDNLRNTNDLNRDSSEIEKDAEFISDIDDERSYTPCLDENKSVRSKDTSIDGSEKENGGIEGLDTELISEDEGNELFSDANHRYNSNGGRELHSRRKGHPSGDCEEGEIIEKNKQKIKAIVKELLEKPEEKISDDEKKRKRRDRRGDKDDKEKNSKGKSKKENDSLAFKKLSKSGRERNYRERDDKSKKTKDKRHSRSVEKEKREKRKEKRKDMERYDVRNIISDRSRRIKDAFGRDKSRPKSNTPDSRVTSPRHRRSSSRRRSVSRRRSISRTRRSLSRRSNSKNARSKSPHRQSNIPLSQNRTAARGLRSISREHRSSSLRKKSISRHRSMSPRKSISPKARSPLRPRSPGLRNRRSISPKIRRSRSPRTRRSVSRNRNRRKTSISRGRRVSPRICRPKSPVRRRLSRRSRSKPRSMSRNRSKSPKSKKQHRLKRNRSNSRCKSKSPIRSKLKRKRSRSFSPTLALSRSLSRDRVHQQNWQETEKSPLYQDWTSGSQSMSPRNLVSPGWTPPPMEKSPEPRNLRVILTTKEKNRKKEKKKKTAKKNRGTDRVLKHQSKDMGPSKEVFTSGNNILVSVSFNKNKDTEKAPIVTTDAITKKKKKKNETSTKPKKDKTKDKLKKKRLDKEKRSKELENKKPVAIIDLDKSPFKELTPSPKAVIVLSDSDTGEKEEVIEVQTVKDKVVDPGSSQPDIESLPCSPNRENTYITPAGPKTPPEPAIKFTIMSKSNPQLRAVNPLHEDEDELNENQETDVAEDSQNKNPEPVHKGPNTPPDPPHSSPSSPDAYDPFEPTKSASATPERVPTPPPQIENEILPEVKVDDVPQIPCISLEAAQKSNILLDDVIQTKPISPTEKVMALLKSTRASLSPGNSITQIFGDQIFDSLKTSEPEPVPAVAVTALSSPEGNSQTASLTNKVSQAQSAYSAIVKPSSPKPIYSTVAPTIVTSTPVYFNSSVPRIGVFSMASSPSTPRIPLSMPPKITLPSPTKSSPLKSQPKIFMSKPSPIKSTPIKPILSKTIISKLPMPTIKPLPARSQKILKTPTKMGQNGSELTVIDMDMDSPYSPGSSDFGDLFDPPSDNGKHSATLPLPYPQKSSHKIDPFDTLFSIKSKSGSKNLSGSNKASTKQMKKSKGKMIVGVKIDDDNLKILDDLPSSAVEMQVKTKFLKKLNRQERVVEEVKLVLKPHYNKKHITKDEYKDILRRAVPKICHNRSGEINPTKIQALIEAYVKKFRKKAHLPK